MHSLIWILFAAFVAALSTAPLALSADVEQHDWRDDWEVQPGFAISRDSVGFTHPVQLAVVPEPGTGPDDPLYYVVELGGAVKVVSNARDVRDFALVPAVTPVEPLPSTRGEVGAGGICLDPINGYVFVTYAYSDEAGVYRNNIARFSTPARTFGSKPTEQTFFTEIFVRDESSVSHQIGSCQVDAGLLYVSVGDAERPFNARALTSTSGKVLRMTVDGRPAANNPFWESNERSDTKSFVWASGFRNPFGLYVRNDRVFISDNGPAVDRIVDVTRGGDYLYDGSDWSIGASASVFFSPAVSPVALARYRPEFDFFPSVWTDHFFVALSGAPNDLHGIGPFGRKSVVTFKYDLDARRVSKSPEVFLRYRGDGSQLPVGLAFGSDGLFVVPLLPDRTGTSSILRIHYDPEHPHPYDTNDIKKYLGHARILIEDRGCLSCHSFDPRVSRVAPPLDVETLRDRIHTHLTSSKYRDATSDLDRRTGAFWSSYADERRAILRATGREKVERWMKAHLREPRFDNPNSQMPNLGLSPDEIDIIVGYLLPQDPPQPSLTDRLGEARHRYWMIALVVGGAVGLLAGRSFR